MMSYIINTCIFLIVLSILHKALSKVKFPTANSKYFALHALLNAYMITLVMPDVILTIKDPIVFRKSSFYPSFLTFLFHIYHIYCYDNIPSDEKVHHLVNVFLMTPMLWYSYNSLCNFGLFFMMGLPGGTTYAMLVMRDMGIMSSLTEKKISRLLNLWLRAPGCIVTVVLIYIQLLYTEGMKSDWIIMFVAIFSMVGIFWNGVYFMQTIVESYVRHSMKVILKEDGTLDGVDTRPTKSPATDIRITGKGLDEFEPHQLRKRKSPQ